MLLKQLCFSNSKMPLGKRSLLTVRRPWVHVRTHQHRALVTWKVQEEGGTWTASVMPLGRTPHYSAQDMSASIIFFELRWVERKKKQNKSHLTSYKWLRAHPLKKINCIPITCWQCAFNTGFEVQLSQRQCLMYVKKSSNKKFSNLQGL